jgi:hypothetical protein
MHAVQSNEEKKRFRWSTSTCSIDTTPMLAKLCCAVVRAMGKDVDPPLIPGIPGDPVVDGKFAKDADSEPGTSMDSGQARLHALGYRQELRRTFNAFTSFACGLALMANSSGITGARCCRAALVHTL